MARRWLVGALLRPVVVGGVVAAGLGWTAPAPAAVVVSPTPLARYREAHALLAGGEYARAQAAFDGLPANFVLADYAAFHAAESLLRLGDEEAALDRFRAFPDRYPDSALVPAALLAAHDTAFRLGRWTEAVEAARRVLARAPGHPETGRILVRLAESRAALGAGAEAMADLRRRWVEAPASMWGEAAGEILADLTRAAGQAPPALSGEERLLQGQRLIEAGEVTAGTRLLDALLDERPDPDLAARAALRLGPALGRIKRGAEGVDRLQAVLDGAPPAWRPALLLELARLLLRTGQGAAAAAVLERLLADHPGASQVADALLALARTRQDLGQPAAGRAAYQRLLGAHGEGVAANAARWELAWLDYRGGRPREAALGFRQLAQAATGQRLAGLYWSARALEATGERAAAAALYREAVSRGPNAYYGLLAERRLRERRPPPAAPALRLASDPLVTLAPEPHYQKARALWSVGFEGHALGELELLGRDAAPESDRAWGLSVALADLGEVGRSLRYLRRYFGQSAEAGAPGLPPRFWPLYYPLGYADLVREAARRAGLDPFFVAAVIREESSYDPRARSGVGAVGLMQLMPDTARDLAAEARVPFAEPTALWEPPLNITLGAVYLGQLRARFQEPLLAVASYNAGPHRVQRWLGERRLADLDEWVDQIPFDETRAFVKRVSTSWHHYRRLYGPAERPPQPGEAEAGPRRSR